MMKKFLLLSSIALMFMFTIGASKSFADCYASCGFSKCSVVGCDGDCGCYFGIAVCHCYVPSGGNTGNQSGPGGDKGTMKKKSFNKQAIDDFNNYAVNSGYRGLVTVGRILQQFTEENFDAVFESYKAEISQLSDRELELLKLYTE